jgi:hypothetical protein
MPNVRQCISPGHEADPGNYTRHARLSRRGGWPSWPWQLPLPPPGSSQPGLGWAGVRDSSLGWPLTAAQEYCHGGVGCGRQEATPSAQARCCPVAGTLVFRDCWWPAQHREEPQCGRAGPGGGERDGSGGPEHQEYLGRLGDHHHRQADRQQQQEDSRPQPGRSLEGAGAGPGQGVPGCRSATTSAASRATSGFGSLAVRRTGRTFASSRAGTAAERARARRVASRALDPGRGAHRRDPSCCQLAGTCPASGSRCRDLPVAGPVRVSVPSMNARTRSDRRRLLAHGGLPPAG